MNRPPWKMRTAKCSLLIKVACAFALADSLAVAGPFTFDDIEFWVGTGANRAALAVDWVETSTEPPALVWGYRWEGDATGGDMLTAIVAADDRLFAKLGSSSIGLELYGLGYDADADGQFTINDGTQFDGQGIALGSRPFNPATSTDPDDYYAEGWFIGFWHYGNAADNPFDGGTWIDSNAAFNARELSDGDWDSWAFTPTFDFAAYAENPQAAPSPFPPGDYDQSGTVDAEDYQFWKDNFGSTSVPAADGSGNGIVDAADYTVWRDHLGTSSSHPASIRLNVPEPCTAWLASYALWLRWFLQRKDKVR